MSERLETSEGPWYSGITGYQWLVLLIASLGWVFDVFEGQIFVASMNEAMPSLVPEGTSDGRIAFYNNIAFGAFLLGGAVGGVLFGMLGDRIGRTRAMSLTILFYSLFTLVSAFSQEWWHLAGLRFLVAMGVGGEWAIASSLVAEVFPKRARAHVGSIFHGSSVFGTYLAILAGTFLIGNEAILRWASSSAFDWLPQGIERESVPWRLGFGLGAVPAVLILWIRLALREPESWTQARQQSKDTGKAVGSLGEIFSRDLLGRTLLGVTLASVGMATFWGTHIYGKDMLVQAVAERSQASVQAEAEAEDAGTGVSDAEIAGAEAGPTGVAPPAEPTAEEKALIKRWEMLGLFLTTTGGGIGLVCFGPISQLTNRRVAFALFHLGGLISAIALFQFVRGVWPVMVMLPVFGFLTLGMHAGYAIYFPELYPTRVRGTGAGFCFNAGRMIAAPALFAVGWLQLAIDDLATQDAATGLSLLFLVALPLLLFAPETKGRELPE